MRRIGLAVVLALGLALAPLVAKAQDPAKTYRIGWLAYGWTEGAERTSPEFVQELKKHLQNFVFEFRGHRDAERMPGLARELVQLGVDVIVANGTVAAQAARSVTQSVPIVFLISGDPVGSGLVTSLARPGGNVTGPSAMSSDFATKRLELFKQAIPSLNRVGVLSTSYDGAAALASWNGIEAAASQAGLQIQRITARDPADFENAFATVAKEKINGLLIINDPRFVAARNRLAELALRNRVPTMFEEWRFVEAGGLIAYGPSYPEIFRSAARYVDKILKGAKPADLPVEQPSKFELVINLKTAKALGLTIPPSVLARADQVIDP
jgi:putative tryptophan/tyrosine transport system substrate-binding protein